MARAQPYRDAFIRALVERDSARARRAVDEAPADGVEIPDVYLDVLASTA
jgi:hypothetical protein